MKLKIMTVRQTLEKILSERGLSKQESLILADEYLEGELQGKYSHGLATFPSILSRIGDRGTIEIIKKTHSLIFIDAHHDFGSVVGRKIVDELGEMVKKEFFAVGLIKNMITWLRPGTIAKIIADNGYIGIVMNTGGRPMVAPPGGYQPVIGTNPIGIGIPTDDQPIVIDMATAKKAWGVVRVCEKLGRDLPANTFYDRKGNITVKPEEAYSVVPFGDYKGFALGLLIEIICGSMIGMPMGSNNLRGDYRTLPRGAVILVINPAVVNLTQFKGSTTKLIKEIKNSQKLAGTESIHIPGERSLRTREKNITGGYIDVDEKLWQEISNL